MQPETRRWIETDRAHCWHPFTRQDDWCADGFEPLVLQSGEGPWLIDTEGRRYLDGNSSIWTNIHGHGHPAITSAIARQARELSHSSFLGFTHPGAIELAARLCSFFPNGALERVFFSDNGSTAIECALRMALQFREQTGEPGRRGFLAFDNAYHGDTLGAVSIGGVSRFTGRFQGLGYEVTRISSLAELSSVNPQTVAAVLIEPLIQGVNEMRLWPSGMLRDLRAWCDARGVHLILDEVMTGFGRTGSMFACQQEEVYPDFLCLAKGLTGGLLPLAATLTTAAVYDAFRGGADRAFCYGHSYTANPLGCSAALASLDVFETEQTLARLPEKKAALSEALARLKRNVPLVHETRQIGLISGIELRQPNGDRFPPEARIGESVCLAARNHGLLTRPILDTLVFMPPLCTSHEEISTAIEALETAIHEL